MGMADELDTAAEVNGPSPVPLEVPVARGAEQQFPDPFPMGMPAYPVMRADASAVPFTINWDQAYSDTPVRRANPGSTWVKDFVQNLGQSEASRNPNASLRVQIPVVGKTTPALSRL